MKEMAGLIIANLDLIQAAAEYRESVNAPYRGKMPVAVLNNMEEQLSGFGKKAAAKTVQY